MQTTDITLAKSFIKVTVTKHLDLPCISALAHVSAANTLTMLIKDQQRSQFIEDTIKPSFSCPELSSFSSCVLELL